MPVWIAVDLQLGHSPFLSSQLPMHLKIKHVIYVFKTLLFVKYMIAC